MQISPEKYSTNILLMLPLVPVMLVAALLRMLYPDLIKIKYDEAWLVDAAYKVAYHGSYYPVGQDTSIGAPTDH